MLAAPIWAEFMKRAIALPNYSDVKGFTPPSGVVTLSIDKVTGQIATPACPEDYVMTFIEGTQPTQTCEQATADHRNIFQKLFGLEAKPIPPGPVSNPTAVSGQAPAPDGNHASEPAQQAGQNKPKKKGFWERIFGGKADEGKEKEKDKKPFAPGAGFGP